jgi:phage-related protein
MKDKKDISKTIIWLGNSKKILLKFPAEVRRDIGFALYFAQIGEKHPNVKMLKGLGSGVYEVVEDYRADTFRAVYTVHFKRKIYVLHVFQKKSKSGIKTPNEDTRVIKERLKRAQELENEK